MHSNNCFHTIIEVFRLPQPIRIVSYNIRHGTDYRDYPSMDRIVAVLSDLDADVIALQEVDMNLPRSGRQKQAAELARDLTWAMCSVRLCV